MRHRRPRITGDNGHLDLVPLIDCIFLILLFFVLAGRLDGDQRPEQITVPPGKTASRIHDPDRWSREIIQVGTDVRIGAQRFALDGSDWAGLRALLDRIHDRAGKTVDGHSGLLTPDVIVEVRADADAPSGTVQGLQQLLSDTIDPTTGLPKSSQKPFIHLAFSARDAG